MKTVVDRIVQYANRYKLTNAETGAVLGTFDFDEVTGTVQQVGTEIDAELFQSIADDLAARVKLSGGELKDTVVTFSDISGTAENVASGDTSATLWGKVKNWFSRLKALAFKDKISNADVDDNAAIAQSKISGLASALDGKQSTVTGAASTIVTNNLMDNRALVSNASGKVAVSNVTADELNRLDGVTANVQEQINNIVDGTTPVEKAKTASEATTAENSPKSLYNLGAYDTFVDNGNGTATITRKTGYFNLTSQDDWASPVAWTVFTSDSDANIVNFIYRNLGNTYEYSPNKTVCNVFRFSADGSGSWNNPGATNINFFHYPSSIRVDICFDVSTLSGSDNKDKLIRYLSVHAPVLYQYEVPEGYEYTEDVILDQPIHTIDQHGEQWLRDEWEKGLNLIDDSSVAGTVLATSRAFDVPVILEAGDYSICIHVNDVSTVANVVDGYLSDASDNNIVDVTGQDDSSGDNAVNRVYYVTVTASQASQITKFHWYYNNDGGISGKTLKGVSIYRGRVQYPYQPYNGKIIHENDLADYATKDDLDGLASEADLANYLPLTGGTVDGNLNVTDELQENGQRVYSPNNPQPLADSGVTAGNYGQPNDATPAAGDTFKIPYITVDAKGRITDASTKKITMPSGTSGQDGQDGAGIYTATVNSANPLQFFVFYYQTQPTPKIGDTFICDDLWDTSHDTNYGGNVYTIQSIVSSEAGGLIVTGLYDNLNLKGEDGQDGTNGTDGTDGLNMFYSSFNYFSYTQYITYSSLTIPDGYEIKVGDLILCANGSLFSVIATDSNKNRATVDYQSSLAGADGTSATISNVTATVDNNVGTPSVDVTLGGTSLNRTFNFEFHNLKGEQGEPGGSPKMYVHRVTIIGKSSASNVIEISLPYFTTPYANGFTFNDLFGTNGIFTSVRTPAVGTLNGNIVNFVNGTGDGIQIGFINKSTNEQAQLSIAQALFDIDDNVDEL